MSGNEHHRSPFKAQAGSDEESAAASRTFFELIWNDVKWPTPDQI